MGSSGVGPARPRSLPPPLRDRRPFRRDPRQGAGRTTAGGRLPHRTPLCTRASAVHGVPRRVHDAPAVRPLGVLQEHGRGLGKVEGPAPHVLPEGPDDVDVVSRRRRRARPVGGPGPVLIQGAPPLSPSPGRLPPPLRTDSSLLRDRPPPPRPPPATDSPLLRGQTPPSSRDRVPPPPGTDSSLLWRQTPPSSRDRLLPPPELPPPPGADSSLLRRQTPLSSMDRLPPPPETDSPLLRRQTLPSSSGDRQPSPPGTDSHYGYSTTGRSHSISSGSRLLPS